MSDPITITQFRGKAGPYFSGAVRDHQPLLIQRGAEDFGLLLGAEEALLMLGDRRFNPEVTRSDGGVSVWLPEFAIDGQGDNYGAAREDLLNEVRYYVGEYMGNARQFLAAPNRRAHFPYVLKARFADLHDQLADVIFPGPPEPAQQVAAVVIPEPLPYR